jgi:hypothetical protein
MLLCCAICVVSHSGIIQFYLCILDGSWRSLGRVLCGRILSERRQRARSEVRCKNCMRGVWCDGDGVVVVGGGGVVCVCGGIICDEKNMYV